MESYTEGIKKLLNLDLITQVSITSYIRETTLSAAQNPQYFEWDGRTIKGKKPIPRGCLTDERKADKHSKKIIPDHLKAPFKLAVIGKRGEVIGTLDTLEDIRTQISTHPVYKDCRLRLYNKNSGQFVLANEGTVGQPSKVVINGQKIYSGEVAKFVRDKVMTAIKDYSQQYVKQLKKIEPNQYPVLIVYEIVDTVINTVGNSKKTEKLGQRWDVGNRLYPYEKAILDKMVDENILLDDERLYVTMEMRVFTPLPSSSDINRCLNIYIFQDDREVILNNKYYQSLRPLNLDVVNTISEDEK